MKLPTVFSLVPSLRMNGATGELFLRVCVSWSTQEQRYPSRFYCSGNEMKNRETSFMCSTYGRVEHP